MVRSDIKLEPIRYKAWMPTLRKLETEANSGLFVHREIKYWLYEPGSVFITLVVRNVTMPNGDVLKRDKIGYIVYTHNKGCTKILNIYIKEFWRNKNIGKALLKSMMETPKTLEQDKVIVNIPDMLDIAQSTYNSVINFFATMGFTQKAVSSSGVIWSVETNRLKEICGD